MKVEGRPDVHIVVRDRIVHIDNTETRLRTIVSIAGTENEPETGTTSLRRNDVAKVLLFPEKRGICSVKYTKISRGRPAGAGALPTGAHSRPL